MIETLIRTRNSATAPILGNQYLAVGSSVSPYLIIYKRNGDTYTKLPNPASMPPTGVTGVAWNDSTHLACSHSNHPYVTVYKRSGDTFTKLSNFTTNEGAATTGRVRFNFPAGYGGSNLMAFNYSLPPYFKMFSISGDTFSMYSNPSALGGGGTPPNVDLNFLIDVGFGQYLATAQSGIFMYTVGNPPVRITQGMTTGSTVRAVAADYGYLQVIYSLGSTIYFYDITSASPTFAAASPSSMAHGGNCRTLERDSYGMDYLFAGSDASPYLKVYSNHSGSTFSLSANPPSEVVDLSVTYALNPTVACAHTSSPYVSIYNFNGSSTFNKVSNPATLPPGAATAVAFSNTF